MVANLIISTTILRRGDQIVGPLSRAHLSFVLITGISSFPRCLSRENAEDKKHLSPTPAAGCWTENPQSTSLNQDSFVPLSPPEMMTSIPRRRLWALSPFTPSSRQCAESHEAEVLERKREHRGAVRGR